MKYTKILSEAILEPIILHSQFGEGNCAIVCFCTYQGKKCAVKFLRPLHCYESQSKYESSKQNLYSESNILSKISHQYIVSLLCCVSTGKLIDINGASYETHYFIMEALEGGDILSYKKANEINEHNLRIYAQQITTALLYLHEKGIFHCDIKSENIMLTGDLTTAKLVDFDFAVINDSNNKMILRGTPGYAPPELICGIYSNPQKGDVFTLGVVFFSLITNHFPCYKECTQADPVYRILCERLYTQFWSKFKVNDLSEDFKALIQNMLDLSPSRRPTIKTVCEHRWLISIRNEELKEKSSNN